MKKFIEMRHSYDGIIQPELSSPMSTNIDSIGSARSHMCGLVQD